MPEDKVDLNPGGDKPEPAASPEPAKAAPAEGGEKGGEGAEPQEPKTIEDWKNLATSQKESMDQMKSDLESQKETIETQGGRIESLQESLESAMEELTMKGGQPKADTIEDKKPEPAQTPEDKKPAEPTDKKPDTKDDSGLEEKLQEAIDEDKDFREETILRHEMGDLKEELDEAIKSFPEADRNEILLGVEDGLEEDNPNQIEVLAKASHDKHVGAKAQMKKEMEDELRAKIKKESEGGHSLPQSQGTPSTSEKPQQVKPSPEAPRLSEEAQWDEALTKAKAEGASEE